MRNTTKVVIIDDENKVRSVLEELLGRLCPDLTICGSADSAVSGYQLIREHQPELVFLDVEMPGGNGFDLLKMFDSPEFAVIFITAHDQYAIKAIKFSALDYILKPVHSTELLSAVDKFRENRQPREGWKELLENLASPNKFRKIGIPSISRIQFIKVNEIIYLEAEGSYTCLHLESAQKILSTRPIREYETMLSESGFFRVNRSYIINLLHVNEYIKNEKDKAKLSNKAVVEFSRKRRTAFLEAIQEHSLLKIK